MLGIIHRLLSGIDVYSSTGMFMGKYGSLSPCTMSVLAFIVDFQEKGIQCDEEYWIVSC